MGLGLKPGFTVNPVFFIREYHEEARCHYWHGGGFTARKQY